VAGAEAVTISFVSPLWEHAEESRCVLRFTQGLRGPQPPPSAATELSADRAPPREVRLRLSRSCSFPSRRDTETEIRGGSSSSTLGHGALPTLHQWRRSMSMGAQSRITSMDLEKLQSRVSATLKASAPSITNVCRETRSRRSRPGASSGDAPPIDEMLSI